MGAEAAVHAVFQLREALLEGVAAEEEFLQHAGRPLPELDAPLRIDAVAERDDDIQIEVFQVADDVASALAANCSNFSNSWTGVQFAAAEDVPQVVGNTGLHDPEQYAQLRVREPYGVLGEADLQPGRVVGLVDNDFVSGCVHGEKNNAEPAFPSSNE